MEHTLWRTQGGFSVMASGSSQLILILLTETVSHREEFPATLLVHFPHIGFLAKTTELECIFEVINNAKHIHFSVKNKQYKHCPQ